MRKPKLSTITWITVVFTVLWCAWWLRDLRPVVVRGNDMDINSGDIRHCVFLRCPWLGDMPVKSTVHESRLSQEARRLGLGIPSTRAWRLMDRHYDGVFEDGVYGLCASGVPNLLLRILDETKTPDAERRAILEKFMTSLRTRSGFAAEEQGYVLIQELCDKHGLDIIDPMYRDDFRRSEFWGK